MTIVQAADLAESGLFKFQATLRDRSIPQHCDQADLEADLLALRVLGISVSCLKHGGAA